MSRFLRVLFITGLPMGLLSRYLFAYGLEMSWVDFILTAVGPGLLFGLVLGAIAYLLTARIRTACGGYALLFILMAFAAGATAWLIYTVEDAIPRGRWVRMEDPPERVVEFAGPTCYYIGSRTVYIKTEGGGLFSYDCPKTNLCQWNRKTSISEVGLPSSDWCQDRLEYRPPPMPGAAVASYQVLDVSVDCSGQTHYILLQDGSVWKWTRGECAISTFFIMAIFAVASLLLSFVGTLSLVVFDKSLGRSGQAAPP